MGRINGSCFVFVLILVVYLDHSHGFSSISSPHGNLCDILRKPTVRCAKRDDNSVEQQKPYAPDGLTLEQYQKIKLEEEDARRKMNFGAWGPRFRQSARPDGDWMLMRRLWTDGAIDRPTQGMGGSRQRSSLMLIQKYVYQYLPAFAMSFFLIASIHGIFVSSLHDILAIYSSESLKKVLTRVVLPLTVLSPLLNHLYLEPINRFFLWSKRRTVTITSSTIAFTLFMLRKLSKMMIS